MAVKLNDDEQQPWEATHYCGWLYQKHQRDLNVQVICPGKVPSVIGMLHPIIPITDTEQAHCGTYREQHSKTTIPINAGP